MTAIVGDITPSDGVPKEEKSRRESAALHEMCQLLGGGMRGTKIFLDVSLANVWKVLMLISFLFLVLFRYSFFLFKHFSQRDQRTLGRV